MDEKATIILRNRSCYRGYFLALVWLATPKPLLTHLIRDKF